MFSIIENQHFWTFVFYGVVLILVIANWRKFEIQGKIMAIYRTRIGISLMEKYSTKYRELVKLLGVIGIGVCYVGMIVAIFAILLQFYLWVIKPFRLDGSPLVLPGVPLAGTGGVVFPLVIGWITFFIVMIVHEFSHGVVAKAHGVKILSSGMVFLGPILGAFVEPDDKQIKKKSDIVSYSIFSAGPFSNLVLAVVVILAMVFILNPISGVVSSEAGVLITPTEGYPAKESGIQEKTSIHSINGITTLDATAFSAEAAKLKPGDKVVLSDGNQNFEFITVAHPIDESRGYMGVEIQNHRVPKGNLWYNRIFYPAVNWLIQLFNWIYIISASIGLINLVPFFITDGARILKITFDKLIADKKKSMKAWVLVNKICLMIFLAIVFVPLLRALF